MERSNATKDNFSFTDAAGHGAGRLRTQRNRDAGCEQSHDFEPIDRHFKWGQAQLE
jgi:hypothetical protein